MRLSICYPPCGANAAVTVVSMPCFVCNPAPAAA